MLGDRLIGPHIFQGHLTGEMYLEFLREELFQLLDNVPLHTRQGMYFQHDGAPAHFSRNVVNFFNEKFGRRWIGRGGPIAWPARSPDLNPLDYCLWGWMKDIVYSARVNTREELVQRIHAAAEFIRGEQVRVGNATRAVHTRAAACITAEGRVFENVL